MTASAVALAPGPVTGPGTGASAEILTPTLRELTDRAARPDYDRWLAGTASAGGCRRPVQLRGEVHDLDARTGEILTSFHTGTEPDGVIYKACGDRRTSVCPACAETYRRDAYQLIRAGMAGGKGDVPESVAAHPCVFATFTAPSFGLVHTRRTNQAGRILRCRPRRVPEYCRHGRELRCRRIHKDGEACLGKPLCPDCYDYNAAVVWNAHAPELWRRTMIGLRRRLDRIAKAHGTEVKVSYAKVAEFQTRGVVHFHALIRLDGHDTHDPGAIIDPPACVTAQDLAEAIRAVAGSTWFATVGHPAKPDGWTIGWGPQLDVRTVSRAPAGEVTDGHVASYLAKYATKSTETVGGVPGRITLANLHHHANPRSHHGRLIRAAWHLGGHNHDDFKALRRWAHMLGFRGHFITKSRGYSVTLKLLRTARADWRRRRHRTAEHTGEETTLVVGLLSYAGSGWRTTGDALLALTAAAKAREHDRIAREEITTTA